MIYQGYPDLLSPVLLDSRGRARAHGLVDYTVRQTHTYLYISIIIYNVGNVFLIFNLRCKYTYVT